MTGIWQIKLIIILTIIVTTICVCHWALPWYSKVLWVRKLSKPLWSHLKADARKMGDKFLRCLFCWSFSSSSLLAKKNALNQCVSHSSLWKGFAETLDPDASHLASNGCSNVITLIPLHYFYRNHIFSSLY